MNDSSVCQDIEIAKEARCEMGMYIERLENMREDPVELELNNTKRIILGIDSTRRQTYIRLNTNLVTHNMYNTQNKDITEFTQKSFTRLRLGSH